MAKYISKTEMIIWWLTEILGCEEIDYGNRWRTFKNPEDSSKYFVSARGKLRRGNYMTNKYEAYIHPGKNKILENGSYHVNIDMVALEALYREVAD